MVSIKDHFQNDLVIDDIKAVDKNGVLREFAGLLKTAGKVREEDGIVRVLAEREALGSTGIGDGVAIPHGKVRGLREIVVAFWPPGWCISPRPSQPPCHRFPGRNRFPLSGTCSGSGPPAFS